MVIADLLSKVVILDRKNQVVASLGEGEYSNKELENSPESGSGDICSRQVRLSARGML